MALEGTLLGPYRLVRSLGSGVAGDTYLAMGPTHRLQTGQVAVKVLRGDVFAPMCRALLDQVGVVAAMRQHSIVPIYAIGEHDGVPYVAQSYLPEGSLAQRSASLRDVVDATAPAQQPLQQSATGRAILGVAHMLEACHRHGIMHGDLKPQNVFLRVSEAADVTLHIADFGQAQYVEALAARQPCGVTDTLLYAAPEQWGGETLPSSDQYSLAEIAYFLLTGVPPHARITAGDTQDTSGRGQLLPSTPTPRHYLTPAPELASAAEEVLLRGMAREPIERFETALAFAEELSAAIDGRALGRVRASTPALATTAQVTAGAEPSLALHHGSSAPLVLSPSERDQILPVYIGEAPHPKVTGVVVGGAAVLPDTATPHRPKALLSMAAVWHVASYVLVGVASTGVNLICFQALYVIAGLPYPERVRYLIAWIGAAEVATMFNFVLNDRFTFASYDGRNRPLLVRAVRFHTTVINGFILTFVLSAGLHYGLGFPALVSQAVGIFVAFLFNFTVHHLWTYRARKRPAAKAHG
jgi:serine/threonine-protein kinase